MFHKLFIGGISAELTEIDIAQLVSLHGNLKSVKFVYDRKTNKHKGFGFIELATVEDAQAVIAALDGTSFGKYELQLKGVIDSSKTPQNAKPADTKFKTKRPRISKL